MRKEIDPEKLRTMIRSILPSVARRFARRAKAAENRTVRRGVRMALRNEDEKADPRRNSRHSGTVAWRRGADKLNHFMRWCEELTEGMSTREALDHIRALLPRNLIGDHAYSHWEGHRRRRRAPFVSWKEEQRRATQSLHDRTCFALRRLLTERPEVLGELNAAIKRQKTSDEPRRLLFGIHDVEAFTRDVFITQYGREPRFTTERAVVESYILSGRPSGRPRCLAA
ncbi:MAG TPA: hypothetical protein VGF28_04820 [Thermoanaerobaculia bacterium]|jgi:hypothetical protein